MDFNDEQLAAIRSDARNLMVLAGAGTGKTRTIIGRARHLVDEGVSPQRIVIVTFTRRAANEIRARLGKAAGGGSSQVVTGTFHHLCLRIMSAKNRWFGFENRTVMDRDDQLHLMRLVRGEIAGKSASIPQAAELVNFYSYARNTNQPPRDYLSKYTDLDQPAIDQSLQIFEAYKSRKHSNRYWDYDDILHRFAKVLHDDADVRRQVCSRYEHVLVDEMQDTNPLQWLILQSFAEFCHLFCVGDDAQSIYAFRGADFRNVHSFEERLRDSQTLKLQQNYRSTQPILDLANWLLGESSLKYAKELTSIRGDGIKPCLLDFDSDFDEAEWIVQAIKERRAQGADWSEHMILCRTTFSARPIEAMLIEENVPYQFIGGISLLQMAHVRDLLSALRLVVNYRDELAWMRYLTLWPKIGEVTAARILEQVVTQTTAENALERLVQALHKRSEIVALPVKLSGLAEQPARAIEVARGLLEPLLESKYDQWDNRKRDLVLIERLAEKHRSISGFLENYTLDPVSASEFPVEQEAEGGLVTLITVHSAKGTECDVCFVPAVQPGNYPHSRSLEDEDDIEEERRVLYVALTRAKNELILSRHLNRGYGRISWNAAAGSHYFLNHLPNRLVDGRTVLTNSRDYLDDDVIG